MIATIVFVYGLIFPSADSALVAPLEQVVPGRARPGREAESPGGRGVPLVWGHFSEDDRRAVASAARRFKPASALLMSG